MFKTIFRRAACAAAIILVTGFAATAAPVNDLIGDAIALPGISDVMAGTTAGASIDTGAPFAGTAITSPGVWYSLEGRGSTVTLTTDSLLTTYDTKLSVYRDFSGSLAGLTSVGGNDDASFCIFASLCSSLQFAAESGVIYHVLVHGFGGASGGFGLIYNNPPAAAIPLPAAGWLALAGLGGLAALRRRARKAP